MENSLMDNVLSEDNKKELENIKQEEKVIEPITKIGDYQRKYSFEKVIESLSRIERNDVSKLITDNERNKFLGIIYKINTQLEYFQLFDREYEILLKKRENNDSDVNRILEDVEFELKQFDVVMKFMFNSLNDWLNIKGFLNKEITPQDWFTYTKNVHDKYAQECEDNAVLRIQNLKKENEEKMIKTNYLFYEYYDTFIKDKPLM